MRYLLIAIALALASSTATAQHRGPIRQFIYDHRPGLVFPKYDTPRFAPFQYAAPACICADNCTCAPGACPTRCPVQFTPATFYAAPACPSCTSGKCAIPKK